jgi:metal-dependent amidase/aminoacylase/carboxypeptidase family protein
MKLIKEIVRFAHDLTAIRRDLQANPEIGFEEVRTARHCTIRTTF